MCIANLDSLVLRALGVEPQNYVLNHGDTLGIQFLNFYSGFFEVVH